MESLQVRSLVIAAAAVLGATMVAAPGAWAGRTGGSAKHVTASHMDDGDDQGEDEDQGEVRCCLPEDDQDEQDDQDDQGDHPGVHAKHGRGNGHDHGDDGDEDGEDENGIECEHTTLQDCIDAGGSDIGPGSCEPNPCASPSGAFLDGSAGF